MKHLLFSFMLATLLLLLVFAAQAAQGQTAACSRECAPLIALVADTCALPSTRFLPELAAICALWEHQRLPPLPSPPTPPPPVHPPAAQHERERRSDASSYLNSACSDACTYGSANGTIRCSVVDARRATLLAQTPQCTSAFEEFAGGVASISIVVNTTQLPPHAPPTRIDVRTWHAASAKVRSFGSHGDVGASVVAAIGAAYPNLEGLACESGSISSVPAGALDSLVSLDFLSLSHNSALTQLEPGAFRMLTALATLRIVGTAIVQLPPAVLAPLTQLRGLFAFDNLITQLAPDAFAILPHLKYLYLSNNLLTEIPANVFDRLTVLLALDLSRNRITQLPSGIFDKLTGLTLLDLSGNTLVHLSQNVFGSLASLTLLSIANTALREAPTFPFSLQFLNISNNPLLVTSPALLSQEKLRTLDISGTTITDVNMKCTRINAAKRMSLLSAHRLITSDADADQIFRNLATTCLWLVDVLDLSENNHLSSLDFVSATLAGIVYILPVDSSDKTGVADVSQIKLGANSPVSCTLDVTTSRRCTATLCDNLPAMHFTCSCSLGYYEKAGKCAEIPPFWNASRISGLAFGMVMITALAFVSVLVAISRRRVRADLQLKQRLLHETQEEVLILKRAWEILPSELNLDVRIDGDSPGAFGEVWRATWGGITVAVKLLQRSVMDFDEAAQEEFHNEIEFMQKTRQPNIVRFFGAGKWHNGVPFFVVELVSNGSLKVFLRGKQQGRGSLSAGGMGGEVPRITWDCKLRLALDVAQGMAHIHNLGHIHRDPKTGNVLITQDLRAKITDFGTIRELATHGALRKKQASSATPKLSLENAESMDMTAGKGTPLYMAPEVIRGGQYAQSADVWSFAVLLWEIAAQKAPDVLQEADSAVSRKGPIMSTLLAVLEKGTRLRAGADWPTWYVMLMEKCWAGEGKNRPSFAEIVHVLEGRM